MRAGEVAAAARVNIQTLRYYERRGILAAPDRSLGGHRVYREETVTTLKVIKSAQRLGFTLSEIAELLDTTWRRHSHETDTKLRKRTEAKVAEIDAKIEQLTTIRASLNAAVDAGCDDLAACVTNPGCPLSLGDLAS